jgi:bifunctional polynucleotide phosphatase/kinase
LYGKIQDLSRQLGISIQAFLAAAKDKWRKPSMLNVILCLQIAGTSMWDYFVKNCNGGQQVNIKESMYIGDAAGRAKNWKFGSPKDISCSDRAFAHNIGVEFKTPEEFFLGEAPAIFQWDSIDPQNFLNTYSQSKSIMQIM